MSAYRKFDVSAFLVEPGSEKIETQEVAIPAIPAISPQNPRVSAGSGIAEGCYSVAIPGLEWHGYRKFDLKSVIPAPPTSDSTAPLPPPSIALEPDNFDAEERAAIIEFDGQPSQPEATPPPAFHDLPDSRPAIVPASSEKALADWSERFGVPDEWVGGYQAMVSATPRGVPQGRWAELAAAVAAIFERCARQAIALGWDELDLFGCHARSPVKRLDHQGLVWFVGLDTELIAMTDVAARFRKAGGAVQSITRQPVKEPGGVPVWRLCE